MDLSGYTILDCCVMKYIDTRFTHIVDDHSVAYSTSSTSFMAWWRHRMETFSALLAICAGNSPVSGEFPTQRPVTRSFDVFYDLRLNKRLSKQSWGWWFETLSRSLWRHCNGNTTLQPASLPTWNEPLSAEYCIWQLIGYTQPAVITISHFINMPLEICAFHLQNKYHKISNIKRAKSKNLSDYHLILQLPLTNPLKPGVKLRMKM